MPKPQAFSIPDLSALAGDPVPPGADQHEAAWGGGGAHLEGAHDTLMRIPGVVMVGQTLDAVGNPAFLVGLKSAAAAARVPREIAGLPIVTEVIGEVDALPRAGGR